MNQNDSHFLAHATHIGARNLGRTGQNPSVGCVLVKNHQVVAIAATGETGRPHAETQALAAAGEHARGATAYVTLEPCAHHGKTPPCAQALIDAGIARVVYACADPDPRVSGRGAQMLRDAGIAVEHYSLPSATDLHAGFFKRLQHGMPRVTMKIATSADGAMQNPPGGGQWITGEHARTHGRLLRARVDAILTGIGTVLADDPQLNIRIGGIERPNLVRLVADRHLRLPLVSHLVRTADRQPTTVITTATAIELAASHATDLREHGVNFLVLEDEALAPTTMLNAIGALGVNELLVEAGPQLSGSFLQSNQVDRLYWYRAPQTLGASPPPNHAALKTALAPLEKTAPKLQFPLGADTLCVYELAACLPA